MTGSDLDLAITAVVAGGDGLARDPEGQIVFVSGALPGERVRATVTERKRGFARAAVVEVLDAASSRRSPPCAYVAHGCGGCTWQHIDPGAQRTLKASIVADALRHTGRLEPPEIGLGPDLDPFGHRTTVRAAVRAGLAGFRQWRSNDVVIVDRCLVAHPLIDELIQRGRFGAAREVTLRAGAATGERLAILDPGIDATVALPDDVFVTDPKGRAAIHEDVGGRRWRVSARSFFQTRPDGAQALVDVVRDAARDQLDDGARLIDLYAGVGLFGGALASEVASVVAVEGSASAASDARHNLRDTGARVVRADVNRWRPSAADIVIADPSRSGLGRAAVERIAATGAARFVLVSCDPASLGRDAALLAEAGYALTSVTLVDLFPHTPHVETVSRFDRHPEPGSAP